MSSLSHRHAIRNNTKEDLKLQEKLNRLNSNSLGYVDKIREEMLFLKKQLMENRKVLGTRSDLKDLRLENAGNKIMTADKNQLSVPSSKENAGRRARNGDILARDDSNVSSPRRMLAKTRLSVPNNALLRDRRPNPPPRVLESLLLKEPPVNGSLPRSSRSIAGNLSSPRSLSSTFSTPDRSTTTADSFTKRELARGVSNVGGRRFSLPVCSNPALNNSNLPGQLPDGIPVKARLVQTQNKIPEINFQGKKLENLDRARSQPSGATTGEITAPRARRYSLPICNFEEEDRWLLTAKLPLGKYSQDAVQARLSQLNNLELIKNNKKTSCQNNYGRRLPIKAISPLTESDERGVKVLKNGPEEYREFRQKAQCGEEEDIDQEEDYRPSDDPKLQSIPQITLSEKMERFFAEYIEGAGQSIGVDFEQLLMECRMEQDASEEMERSEHENSDTDPAKKV